MFQEVGDRSSRPKIKGGGGGGCRFQLRPKKKVRSQEVPSGLDYWTPENFQEFDSVLAKKENILSEY